MLALPKREFDVVSGCELNYRAPSSVSSRSCRSDEMPMPPGAAPQIGLALGSGVARGWAHIGVLRALDRAGIRPDIVCGTSIGALVGGAYLAGGLDVLEAWARGLNKLRLTRLFDFHLGPGGLIAGRRVLEIFDHELRGRLIEDLPARFACVATELDTGHEVWLQSGNLLEAVRTSYALPGLVPPVWVNGRWLLDGALVNPVPVSVCRALGARLVIAVNLNTESFGIGSRGGLDAAEESALVSSTAGLPGGGFIRQLLSRRNDAPSILSVMASSLNIVQDRLSRSRLAGDPADVTIAPKLGDIGLLQFDRARESIAIGEQAAEEAALSLKDALRRFNGNRNATASQGG
jgi:NTE family protein